MYSVVLIDLRFTDVFISMLGRVRQCLMSGRECACQLSVSYKSSKGQVGPEIWVSTHLPCENE